MKKNTRKTTKRRSSKKVYIPVWKTVFLTFAIVTVCIFLLLITNLPSSSDNTDNSSASLTERFEQAKDTLKQRGKELDNELVQTDSSDKQKQETKKESSKTVKTEQKKETVKTTEKPKSNSNNSDKNVTKKTTAENTTAKPVQKPNTSINQTPEVKKIENPKENPKTIVEQPPVQKPTAKTYNFPQAQNGAQLVFVFDDGGQNLSQLDAFLSLPFPITVAVMPKLPNSRAAANKIRNSGNEVMLHQPMQSIDLNINPGNGAITPDMTDAQIEAMLFENIQEIGPIQGINNHEGSLITADAEKMETILKFASDNDIFFLDSRTNVETKIPYVSQQLGFSWYERNIFLDNTKTKENALNELKKGLTLANKNGVVIMIGHIWSANFLPEFLKEVYPELKQKGYTFSVVSKSKGKKR